MEPKYCPRKPVLERFSSYCSRKLTKLEKRSIYSEYFEYPSKLCTRVSYDHSVFGGERGGKGNGVVEMLFGLFRPKKKKFYHRYLPLHIYIYTNRSKNTIRSTGRRTFTYLYNIYESLFAFCRRISARAFRIHVVVIYTYIIIYVRRANKIGDYFFAFRENGFFFICV